MEYYFTVHELLAILSGMPFDSKVFIASDEDGHNFKPFDEASVEKFHQIKDGDNFIEDFVVLYPRFEYRNAV